MAPPRASTSFTRCPLPMPPIEGLQDIWPSVSMLCVRSSVFAPERAAASADSVPAWPPPTTITSKDSGKCMGSARGGAILPERFREDHPALGKRLMFHVEQLFAYFVLRR